MKKLKKLFNNQNFKDAIFGFGLVMLIVFIALLIVGCAYKPDHRAYPQTQYGNIICDQNK